MARSPKILAIPSGRMEVERIGTGKDVKLYPMAARNGLGRDRDPAFTGIQLADVEELPAHDAEVAVMSLGMYRRLQVDPRTLDLLAARSVAAPVAETREAVRIYNDLTDGYVAGRGAVPFDVLTPRGDVVSRAMRGG